MKQEYIGDAYDYWKSFILQYLLQRKLLKRLFIDIMNDEKWKDDTIKTYATILNIHLHQVVKHTQPLDGSRQDYFDQTLTQVQDGDLFLDPDIGIKTSKEKKGYLMPNELCLFLNEKQERVVSVYQHIRGQKTEYRIDTIFHKIKENKSNTFCCSYETPMVSMLFFSTCKTRIKAIKKALSNFLGNDEIALRRIIYHE
jgi:hypothetical protein